MDETKLCKINLATELSLKPKINLILKDVQITCKTYMAQFLSKHFSNNSCVDKLVVLYSIKQIQRNIWDTQEKRKKCIFRHIYLEWKLRNTWELYVLHGIINKVLIYVEKQVKQQ